jgi:hypothetical protein
MQMLVEVSVGEVIDKITILELKRQKISDASKLANVLTELDSLGAAVEAAMLPSLEVTALRQELYEINAALWDIEDDIRLCEQRGDFGPRFIELARAVYVTNDRRAAIKKKINLAVGSRLVEEKSYAGSL